MLAALTERTFTPDRTRAVLDRACRLAGLDPRGATLMRHQTNAVYRLAADPVVVKVARPGIRHVGAVVELVRWLGRLHVPTVPLWPTLEQPIAVAGCAVTFWEYLPQREAVPAASLASPLRLLHGAPVPPMDLPILSPVAAIRHSVDESMVLSERERRVLNGRLSALVEPYGQLRYQEPRTLIHADPQQRNALWSAGDRGVVLSDWESASIGPVEWDLVTVEVHCRRFGYPDSEYSEFCAGYGRDVREWSGFPVLRDIRELRMIATNARKSAPGSAGEAEVKRRIAELATGRAEPWRIL